MYAVGNRRGTHAVSMSLHNVNSPIPKVSYSNTSYEPWDQNPSPQLLRPFNRGTIARVRRCRPAGSPVATMPLTFLGSRFNHSSLFPWRNVCWVAQPRFGHGDRNIHSALLKLEVLEFLSDGYIPFILQRPNLSSFRSCVLPFSCRPRSC